MITEDNILRHELVGLRATVSGSANAQLVGTSGLVIDETKSTLVLETQSGTKTVPKRGNTWTFAVSGRAMAVDGGRIARRPAERLVIKA